jgi:hypothetical protein
MPSLVHTPAAASAVPTTRTLRAAVIGTGKISEEHLKYLSGDPQVELVGVCDLSPSLARYAATKFGATDAYTDAATMLRVAKPDVVHVLTPPHTHVGIVTDALTHGAHVVCEKPIAPQRQQLLDLWTLARPRACGWSRTTTTGSTSRCWRSSGSSRAGKLGAVCEVEVRMALQIRKAGRYADTALPHPSHNLPAGVLHEFISHLCYLVPAVHARRARTGGGRRGRRHGARAAVPVGRPRRAGHQRPGPRADPVQQPHGAGHVLGHRPRRQGVGRDRTCSSRTCG